MYAVLKDFEELSPLYMKFKTRWIFKLDVLCPSLLQKTLKNKNLFSDQSAWGAILKSYRIHTFTPLSQLQDFARDYYQYFDCGVSEKQIQKVFTHFRRLGFSKVGHLQKIRLSQIQKRFGKLWAVFFQGVLQPESSNWPWKSFKEDIWIKESFEPDFALSEQEQLMSFVSEILFQISNKHSQLSIKSLELELNSLEDEQDDRRIFLEFHHSPLLEKELPWIFKLLEERLSSIQLLSPVSHLKIRIKPQKLSSNGPQLQLFKSPQKKSLDAIIQLSRKLKNQGFDLFTPTTEVSHLPEESWSRSSEVQPQIGGISFRPLIQFPPQAIPTPESRLIFTERICWIDSEGRSHRRDYYMLRQRYRWAWAFKDESSNWFLQGIME